jgi:hypothetical protein
MIRSRTGFNYITPLVVFSIMVVLSAIVALSLYASTSHTQETACFTDQQKLQKVVNAYYFQNGGWPTRSGTMAGDLFHEGFRSPLVPAYVPDVPPSDDECGWRLDDAGVVVPVPGAEECACAQL